jgi:hypothetical protein
MLTYSRNGDGTLPTLLNIVFQTNTANFCHGANNSGSAKTADLEANPQ